MSTYQTPRNRGIARPSYGLNSSPNFSASTSAALSKSTIRALGSAQPSTPMSKTDAGELGVGDEVNVPGDMHGTVRFIGSVKGKSGVFVGVELAEQFAARGKNDGDVDGISYFTTTLPGAGIFLPVHRAEKRGSPGSMSLDSFPGTPNTPSYSTNTGRTMSKGSNTSDITPKATPQPPPSIPSNKFAQSVGPGVRPSSPQFKPKRPSLPRPESPLRRQPPNLAPTAGSRNLSQSVIGPSRTPAKSSTNFKASTTNRPSAAVQQPGSARPYSRSSSRVGHNGNNIAEEDERGVGLATTSNGRTTSSGSVPSFSQPLRSPSRLGSAGAQDEINRLKKELAERDKRLDEQAASLAEMEQSVKELSSILPDGHTTGEETVAQLRQMLREKNEKISLLTTEFDTHRSDFRSTLDSLEMASTETERVYEEQKRDLLAQQKELLAQLAEVRQGREDFEGVAMQLKSLEELVAELEEGLEESRRGEAEARGEVEFLRGEVERGRSELRREREKVGGVNGGSKRGSKESGGDRGSRDISAKEMEKKDDEIRGLKAIIHGLSSGESATTTTANVNGDSSADSEELERLRTELEESKKMKDQLEEEVETLRREAATTNGHSSHHTRNESEMTATAADRSSASRARGDTIKPPAALFSASSKSPSSPSKASPTKASHDPAATNGNGVPETDDVYCEMCESSEHDTLECTKFMRSSSGRPAAAYSPGKENEGAVAGANGKAEKEVDEDEDKWCALCERDGHLAFDCPEEQY